ncbi:MAG: plastocyanin/azurin family copper-binding protein [Candidatus Limnocylindria bacterium]
MNRRLPWIVGPLLGAGLLLTACGPQAAAEPVATNQVDLPPSYKFEPAAITVPNGTTVTWTNNDNFTHNVRLLDDGGELLDLPPGQSVSFTFTGPGQHRYDCSFHPNDMSGVVVVSER